MTAKKDFNSKKLGRKQKILLLFKLGNWLEQAGDSTS